MSRFNPLRCDDPTCEMSSHPHVVGTRCAASPPDLVEDVAAFHRRFGLPIAGPPRTVDPATHDFRVRFLREELDEYVDAQAAGDLEGILDALLDLVYVAIGTLHFHGMGEVADEAWRRIQRANMAKVRGKNDGSDSKRRSPFDVVKPKGWTAPDHSDLVKPGAA